MPGAELAELRRIWRESGRPGAAKLRDAARRQGLTLSVKDAQAFVRSEAVQQMFAAAPKSPGKITATRINDRWQADLIDFKSRTPEKNDGFRLALIVVDVFSRTAYAEPLKTKEPAEVTEAFQKIQRRATGNVRLRRLTRIVPLEVSTDAGAEFRGVFSQMLEESGVAQRFKEGINSLSVVDSVIRELKVAISKEMVDTGSDSWARALSAAVVAHNANSHSALLGSAPTDVKTTPVLQYELEKKAGFDIAENASINLGGRVEKLRELGAFRVLLPKANWSRAGNPRYGEAVHEFLMVFGQDVKATDGTVAPIRDVLPVPLEGARDVKIPDELRGGGRPIRVEGARAALKPYADALKGFLGPTGRLTLQGAGIKLRGVPGFADAMVANRITGIGSFLRFLRLFPEFVVEGKAPRGTVRLV